jgi:hypothetical protein
VRDPPLRAYLKATFKHSVSPGNPIWFAIIDLTSRIVRTEPILKGFENLEGLMIDTRGRVEVLSGDL